MKMLILAIIFITFLRNIKRLQPESEPLPGKTLLFIAHPDDESMFFAPTLLKHKEKITILCCSSGNLYGEGKRRRRELKELCKYTHSKLAILNFKDGDKWCGKTLALLIKLTSEIHEFKQIITFDKYGVSGHQNHIQCYDGVRIFRNTGKIPCYLLKSKSLFRKYFIDWGFEDIFYKVGFKEYFLPVRMVWFHKSQVASQIGSFIYRNLYCLFSNYMSYNDLFLLRN